MLQSSVMQPSIYSGVLSNSHSWYQKGESKSAPKVVIPSLLPTAFSKKDVKNLIKSMILIANRSLAEFTHTIFLLLCNVRIAAVDFF